MKRLTAFTALLMAALLIFSLAGCKETADDTTVTTPDGQTPPVSDTQSGASADGAQTAPPEPVTPPTVLNIVVSRPMGTDTLYWFGSDLHPESKMVLDCIGLRGMQWINGEYVSDVLTSWEQTGPYSWRLRLYEGITDSEGNPFTAEDMVSCLLTAEYMVIHEEGAKLASVVAADELTVELSFSVSDHNALETLLCGTYLVTNKARELDRPVGIGRYVIKEFDGQGGITLTRREDYWQTDEGCITAAAQAEADVLVFRYEADVFMRTSLAVRGEADVSCGLDSYHAGLVKEGFNSVSINTGETVALFFNMAEESYVVEKPDLRLAVVNAIDRQSFAAGAAAEGLVPSDTHGFVPFGYGGQDIEAAKGYVTSARYRGWALTLICEEKYAETAQIIADQCALAGLNVTVQTVEGDVRAAAAEMEWEMAIAPIDSMGDAAAAYAACFEADENGVTWFNFSRSDVLYVANVVASAAGYDEANIRMLETWLMENHIVIGLYVPYEMCLTSQSAGEPVAYDGCVAVGGLLPPPAEAE